MASVPEDVQAARGTADGAGRSGGPAPAALEIDKERGAALIERRDIDGGVAEHWRIDDGEHVVRFTPEGRSGPSEHHVPGTVADDPIGWFERTRD